MKTIAFFNNKGGVGKTSLVYHLAWMLSELDYRVVAADLDPQANLSGMFLDENRLGDLWEGNNGRTIDKDISPLFEGVGDVSDDPHVEKIGERIGLLVGALALSAWEDDLSSEWPRCLDRQKRAFRVMTAFSRLIRNTREFGADLALIDVGPNLGAINRAALIASDHVVIPLAPDLFSLQGLSNVGPTLKAWREGWNERKRKKPDDLDIPLPSGAMEPAGYIVMRHAVRHDRPVLAYLRWIDKIPSTYRRSIFENNETPGNGDVLNERYCLAHLKDYRSLMPLAQEARKPMFMLKPADGAIGAHQSAVTECYRDFEKLARKIIAKCGIESNGESA